MIPTTNDAPPTQRSITLGPLTIWSHGKHTAIELYVRLPKALNVRITRPRRRWAISFYASAQIVRRGPWSGADAAGGGVAPGPSTAP